ncbi:MAG TPA: polymer-forming cytoskeletal protein [Burkholderiales bacterium]|nr:polymer-forming cytoskeletal protein [Burkholderiales bacterium]
MRVLQKDGFFRKRDDGFTTPVTTTNTKPASPAPAANTAPAETHAELKKDERKADERREAKLVVGPDIKMKGVEISDCDTLVVEGRVEATLDSRVLEIAQHGVFQGTIAVDEAVINGRFDGELTVRKQLVIQSTGRVSGKIRYTKIKVEEGAELSGDMSMLDKGQAAVRKAA